jgi:hypothetical protein
MAFVVGTNPSFVISHHFGEDVLRKFPPTITRIFPSKIQLVFIFKNVDVSQVVTQYLVQCPVSSVCFLQKTELLFTAFSSEPKK